VPLLRKLSVVMDFFYYWQSSSYINLKRLEHLPSLGPGFEEAFVPGDADVPAVFFQPGQLDSPGGAPEEFFG